MSGIFECPVCKNSPYGAECQHCLIDYLEEKEKIEREKTEKLVDKPKKRGKLKKDNKNE